MNQAASSATNPYVGPRTFTRAESDLFFGRDREARDLLARVMSERLLLFYAQSGAGKSSLINTRLIPQLRHEGFAVLLPLGRVGRGFHDTVSHAANNYMFSLMSSIDGSGADPARLADVTLTDFLARLVTEDGERWVYEAGSAGAAASSATPAPAQRYVLIIDQFEEIVTTQVGHWQEREDFFRQLDDAMRADPNLWVVLSLREDAVAALDPYSRLMADRLRARFYMERMGTDAALLAIRRPAKLGGRPFEPGVAEKLDADLRLVRVTGQKEAVWDRYVEPVQLQLLCHQLWENVRGRPPAPITEADRVEAGNLDYALEGFYEHTLAEVLKEPDVAEAGVLEPALRTWFDRELITETGIRNYLMRNDVKGRTGTLPNVAVDHLARRYLLHSEPRGGGTWVELVHDRFVVPIKARNAAWSTQHLSAFQQQASLWEKQSRPDGLLLRGEVLVEAERWTVAHPDELIPTAGEFLQKSQKAETITVRDRKRTRTIRIWAGAASIVAVIALVLAALAVKARQVAITQKQLVLTSVS
jgi:hypothetical protein